ncbi:uncharacterized protein LOC129808618 [Phlebotomus papatasi]|uniref:uncharacterized protein LOC129808618 n=1 Tax=Phlebotomus papatasi TaxID=29031 RepID=UPI00248339FB|nr:uncharacterized protein LOC129808618 [Phlebotomus papatasi]
MTDYLQCVMDNHGPNIVADLKAYMRNRRKFARMIARRKFLLHCRKTGVMPSHIINNVRCLYQTISRQSPFNRQIDNMIKCFQHKILSMEIKVTFWEIREIKDQLTVLQHKLIETQVVAIQSFLLVQEQVFWRVFQRATHTHINKFNVLRMKQLGQVINMPSSEWVVNSTDAQLPHEVKMLLGLSPRFSLPYGQLPPQVVLHMLAEIEDVIHLLPNDDNNNNKKRMIRSKIAQLINTRLTNHRLNPHDKYFLHLQSETRKFIQENRNLIITRSDKGNKTVLMWKEDYEVKMGNIVADEGTYKRIARDPTITTENMNNTLVKKMHDKKYIDFITKKELTTHNSRAPRIYGLPKTHKENMPLRPIVSCINSPTYALSKFITNILKPIMNKGGYNVTDSFEFVDRISSIVVPENFVMISLDVVSLFPNIPRNLALRIAEDLWDDIRSHTPIHKELFMEILAFCLQTSYFTFRGQYYSQTDGMPMGGPLSPAIADLVMDFALTNIMESIQNAELLLTTPSPTENRDSNRAHQTCTKINNNQ